jgi:hypothetical protein
MREGCAIEAQKQTGRRIGMPGRTLVSVIVDRDTGEFSVKGPMTDDRPPAEPGGRRRPQSRPQYSLLPYGDMPPDDAAAKW